ncbi:transposase, partial [Escherichia coli]|uniref:transposase n=1 Tax=Escherichia coli TaxID=562 RepID=UPI00203B843F
VPAYGPQNDVTLKMPAFEWVHVQLHQQKGMISLSPPTICNSAKILNNVKKWQIPRFINTDKAPAYGRALALLKREGRCPSDVEHRQIKYRNNVIECDHGKLKRIIGATLGFKSMKTAYATIKGIEVMRALRKGQASAFYYGDPLGEMRLVSRVFEM